MLATFVILEKYRNDPSTGLERRRTKTTEFFHWFHFEDDTIEKRMIVLLSIGLVISS